MTRPAFAEMTQRFVALAKAGAHLSVVVATLTCASAGIDEAMRIRLQRAVDSVQKVEKIQGVSAAVVIDGDMWSGVAGESHAGRPITPDMVLGIGSNTKTCMAITLLRLQEQGLLKLDEPIRKWLPPHPNIDTTITVRKLLNHTSGVGDYSALKSYRDACLAEPTRRWALNELLDLIPVQQFAPGSSGGYCNTNYLLAGIVAQEVSGLSLYQLFRRELFNPLSMDSTRLFPDEEILGELAHRWMGGRDASNGSMNAEWSGAWAAGAVISTSAEMAQFYDALFSGRVLNTESMTQLTAFVGANDYGLGISRKVVSGTTVIGHTGEIRGYSSVMFRVPSLKANIVVLTNSIPSNPLGVAAAILRVLRDAPTSVSEDGIQHFNIALPGEVYSIEGRFVCSVSTYDELQQLQPATYMVVASGFLQVVNVSDAGSIAIGR
jgi:D-alanyl-D-alanine carboxypeptidase